MVDATDSNRGADELAPRHILEAMTVPDLPVDFADRVMVALAPGGTIAAPVRSSRLPWVIAAASTALAVAAMLALVWFLPGRTQAPSEPTPIVVAAPASSPTPALAPTFGHLVLEVDPVDATVRVDGMTIAGPSPFVVTNLAVGRHAIEVEREGFARWSRAVELPSGPLALPITLQAQPQPPAVDLGTFLPRPSRSATPARPAKPRRSRPRKSDADAPDLLDPFHAKAPEDPGRREDPFAQPPAGVD